MCDRADCKEYSEDPACRPAWVVSVEVEVRFAVGSPEEQILEHIEIDVSLYGVQ